MDSLYTVVLVLAVSCLIPVIGILKVRDNVVAVILLLISSVLVASISYILSDIFLTLLILIVYVGVVITFIVVAASAVEIKRPIVSPIRSIPLILLGITLGLLTSIYITNVSTKYSVSTYTLSKLTSVLINNSEFRTIIILLILLTIVMFLIVIQLCRRGISR